MCGICGIIGFDDKLLLRRMCHVLHHRGPDDDGIFLNSGLGLGVKRLSIIDLGGGHQPVHNEDGSVWIVFNGEIYNYRELRKNLVERGHQFYTLSDTEVIVHLYEEEGDNCVNNLNGMFAFAIWDDKAKKVLLARDRFGIKPLYYTIFDDNLLFASEIKALLQHKEIEREIDLDALFEYLILGYVQHPRTMLKGILKLPPSHTLVYSNKRWAIHRYWSPQPRFYSGEDVDACSSHLNKLLQQSVQMEMVSDVPIGAYLSGGIDSSSIVALMSQAIYEPVRTFTVGFEGDDLSPARMVAEHFHTKHYEHIVQDEVSALLPKIVWHIDEPIDDPATVPTFFVSEFARKVVKVILVGEGADELFGGYQRYKIMLMGKRFGKFLPRFVKVSLFSKFANTVDNFRRLSALLEIVSLLGNDAKSYLRFFSVFREDEEGKLCSDKLLEINRNVNPVEKRFGSHLTMSNGTLLDKLTTLDMSSYLVDELLLRVDKMTMANSVEARVPFLNNLVAQFSLSIHPHLKLKGFTEKYILRRAMSKMLPPTIQKRKKMPFSVPLGLWFRGELREIAFQLLDESELMKTYFKHDHIRQIMKGVPSQPSVRKLWRLLILDIWYRLYVGNDELYAPTLSMDKLLTRL